MRCQEVATFLAEVSGGGEWDPTLIPTGGEVGDSVGFGSVCLPPIEEASMGQDLTIPMGPMDSRRILIKKSKIL